jgi:hypothetical protein
VGLNHKSDDPRGSLAKRVDKWKARKKSEVDGWGAFGMKRMLPIKTTLLNPK